jgi:hypothetical protein
VFQGPRDKLVLERDGKHDHLVFIAWFVFCHRVLWLIKPHRFMLDSPTFSTVSTVCVTRAGAGGGTPSDWKNAEA